MGFETIPVSPPLTPDYELRWLGAARPIKGVEDDELLGPWEITVGVELWELGFGKPIPGPGFDGVPELIFPSTALPSVGVGRGRSIGWGAGSGVGSGFGSGWGSTGALSVGVGYGETGTGFGSGLSLEEGETGL